MPLASSPSPSFRVSIQPRRPHLFPLSFLFIVLQALLTCREEEGLHHVCALFCLHEQSAV